MYTVLKIVVGPFRIREREKEHKAAESKGREKLLFLARQESEGRGEERERERERERLLRAKYCNEPRRFIGSRDKNLSRYVRETRNRFLRLEGLKRRARPGEFVSPARGNGGWPLFSYLFRYSAGIHSRESIRPAVQP